MKRFISAFALLTTAALAFSGCSGDDKDESPGAAGKSHNEGGGGEPPTGNLGCDPEQATTCQNSQDCPFVVDGTARVAAQTCGKEECLQSEDEDCAQECITRDLDMSDECATCYGAFVACTIEKCVLDCIADPDATVCSDCQEEQGCRSEFNTCSGLPE